MELSFKCLEKIIMFKKYKQKTSQKKCIILLIQKKNRVST
jgi:hypothetical protein